MTNRARWWHPADTPPPPTHNANELSSARDGIKQVCSDRETPAALCQQRVYTGEQEETHSSSAASAWTPAPFWWVRAVTWRTGVQMLCTLWAHLTVTACKQLWTAHYYTNLCDVCVKRFHWASFGGTLETHQSKPLIVSLCQNVCLSFQLFLGLMGTAFSSPVCPQNCNHAQHYHRQYFTHVSDLQDSSAAPWELKWVYLLKARKQDRFRLYWSHKYSCRYTTGASGV